MIDSARQERIIVYPDGIAGYIIVPLDQLNAVEAILRDNGVSYWVDSDSISVDGKPPVIFITLARGTDAVLVQQMLDAVN